MTVFDLKKHFFGRKSQLDLLKRRVIDLKEGYRQNIAFLGKCFIGKSSLIHRFLHDLDDDDVIEVYLDLEHKDFSYFAYKTAGSLLYNFSKIKKLPLYDDLNLLMESTKRVLPQTVNLIAKINANLAKGKIHEAYRDLIALPDIFTMESDKFCIIVLDEFQNLEDYGIPHIFQELGKRIMTQRRCLYLLTSSLRGVAKNILAEKLTMLFGNFEVIEINPFDLRTSQAFVEQTLGPIRINKPLKNFLIDFISGHPFYLSILLQELHTLAGVHKQGEVYLPLLTQAIENTIFNRWGILSRHFELVAERLCQGKGQQIGPALLISLANGHLKVTDIASDLNCKKSLVTQKLKRLIDLGIVVKNGTFYYFDDRLFRIWIKYVYQRRFKSFKFGMEEQRLQFREEISQLTESFQLVSKKDLSSRIVDLLYCFDNEALSINGRRYKLPLFREIVPLKIKGMSDTGLEVLRASSEDGLWFIVLKEETLKESDIIMMTEELRKLRQKPKRRVLVSLNDLDVNARLKALQEKMWIWSEEELNTLLNLYDKPYILS